MKRRRVKLYRVLLPKVLFWMVIALVVVVLFRACKREEPVEVSPPMNTTFELTPPPEVDSSEASYTIKPSTTMTQEEAEEALVQAVLNVDHVAGMSIDCGNITYLDLLLLSRLIAAETGPEWPDSPAMAVGEVALNRVASPEFPDTLEEVLYQKGQYEPVLKESWVDLRPTEHTIRLALRLLKGERVLNDPRVVFQCLTEIPTKTIMTYYDVNLDTTTYFCWTHYPELYEKED